MKKIIYLFLSSTLFSYAQTEKNTDNKKITVGINSSFFSNFELDFNPGYEFSTQLTLQKNKSKFSIGPVWLLCKVYDINNFRGGIFSYQYFPVQNKKFNFYLIYDLSFTAERNAWQRYMEYDNGKFDWIKFNSRMNYLKNQFGYGFTMKIYNGFYLNQSMSLGLEYYNYYTNSETSNNPKLSAVYKSGNIFSNSGTCSFLRLGIGYNFEK